MQNNKRSSQSLTIKPEHMFLSLTTQQRSKRKTICWKEEKPKKVVMAKDVEAVSGEGFQTRDYQDPPRRLYLIRRS